MPRSRVFLDFSVADKPLGRVIFELFDDEVPKTCDNFRALCTGEKGLSRTNVPLFYKNSISHRIIKDFMIQAGDFTLGNGKGGESIYGGPFDDEDLSRPVDAPLLLCMANKGPNTNSSQFFVTLRECPHLNGKHVVFGHVLRGEDVIYKLGEVQVDEKSRPVETVLISNSGELELRKPVKPPKRLSPSADEETSRRKKSKKKRSSSNDSDREHSKKSRRRISSEDLESSSKPDEPREETEEEYDARLEREELERIAERRKKELQRVKARNEADSKSDNGGVRFKGRGRMVYVDPEINENRR